MITVIAFLFFYLSIYFLGRGILFIFKFKLKDIYDIPLNILYPIFGLFYLGNMTLLVNFFFPISPLVSSILLAFPLILNFFKLEKMKFNFSIKNLSIFFFTPIVLGVSSSNINLAYDAGLYHLNHQKWLQTEKIVFGLSNNHNRFGYSSIIEHINVNFWLENNFILLHFSNLVFIVVFFQIIYLLLFTKYFKFSVSILIYGLLDNFGFNGGKNGYIEIESIAKQDTPFAIMFIISTYFIYRILIQNRNVSKDVLAVVFIFCLFSIELRLLGFINVLFLVFVLLKKLKLLDTLKVIFIDNFLSVFIGIVFVVKNLITSSCMFYPVKITCFDFLPWSTGNYSSPGAENDALADFHIALTRDNYMNWFSEWTNKEVNFIVFKNAMLTFSIIVLFNVIYKFIKREDADKNAVFLFIYFILSLVVWIITSPGIRFGVGIFLTFVLFISFLYKSEKNNLLNKNIILSSIMYFVVLGLVPQTNNYFSLMENLFEGKIRHVEVPEVVYKTNVGGYGVLPEKGDQCWVNLECVRNKTLSKEKYFSYVIFKR
tara:strand:- start:208 stop:1833 length:1626 start_codon:yes stop_codon:yes gene_type:complete